MISLNLKWAVVTQTLVYSKLHIKFDFSNHRWNESKVCILKGRTKKFKGQNMLKMDLQFANPHLTKRTWTLTEELRGRLVAEKEGRRQRQHGNGRHSLVIPSLSLSSPQVIFLQLFLVFLLEHKTSAIYSGWGHPSNLWWKWSKALPRWGRGVGVQGVSLILL